MNQETVIIPKDQIDYFLIWLRVEEYIWCEPIHKREFARMYGRWNGKVIIIYSDASNSELKTSNYGAAVWKMFLDREEKGREIINASPSTTSDPSHNDPKEIVNALTGSRVHFTQQSLPRLVWAIGIIMLILGVVWGVAVGYLFWGN